MYKFTQEYIDSVPEIYKQIFKAMYDIDGDFTSTCQYIYTIQDKLSSNTSYETLFTALQELQKHGIVRLFGATPNVYYTPKTVEMICGVLQTKIKSKLVPPFRLPHEKWDFEKLSQMQNGKQIIETIKDKSC